MKSDETELKPGMLVRTSATEDLLLVITLGKKRFEALDMQMKPYLLKYDTIWRWRYPTTAEKELLTNWSDDWNKLIQ